MNMLIQHLLDDYGEPTGDGQVVIEPSHIKFKISIPDTHYVKIDKALTTAIENIWRSTVPGVTRLNPGNWVNGVVFVTVDTKNCHPTQT